MNDEKRFLAEVGIRDVRLPIKVPSRNNPDGQRTVGSANIQARIMREFEPAWIDRFIQILHHSKRELGIENMRSSCTNARKHSKLSLLPLKSSTPFLSKR